MPTPVSRTRSKPRAPSDRDLDEHLAAGRRVFDRVVEQIRRHLLEAHAVGRDHDVVRGLRPSSVTPFASATSRYRSTARVDDLGQADRLAVERHRAALGFRDVHQRVQHHEHAIGFLDAVGERLAIAIGRRAARPAPFRRRRAAASAACADRARRCRARRACRSRALRSCRASR